LRIEELEKTSLAEEKNSSSSGSSEGEVDSG
jgi:hypothetical protein